MKLSALVALLPLAGCLDAAPETSVSDEDLFGQVAGAHQTTKQVAWDTAFNSLGGGYALTSFTTAGLFYPVTTLKVFSRSRSTGCISSYTNTDGAASWIRDTSLSSCGDTLTDTDVTAIQWGTSRYDVFWFDIPFGLQTPAHLWHLFYDGAWHTEDLGTTSDVPDRAPVAGSWADGHIDIVWHDTAGQIRRKQFDRAKKGASGFTTGGWQIGDSLVLASVPSGQFSVAEPATNELDIAWRTPGSAIDVTTTTDNGAHWSTVALATSVIDDVPAIASWGGTLMVIGQNSSATDGKPFRSWTRTGLTWTTATFTSDHAFTGPVAAASATRANRMDFLALSGTAVIHAFYQESLPGFVELANPDEDNWCWADSSGAAINYMNLGMLGWTPEATCQFVSTDEGENCCGLLAPAECHRSGRAEDVFDDYGFSWDNDDTLDFLSLRFYLNELHQPVIMREAHNTDGGGHQVVLRDAYVQGGVQYVEIADPANNGLTWVWDWNTLINYNGNWHVDYMLSGFSRN